MIDKPLRNEFRKHKTNLIVINELLKAFPGASTVLFDGQANGEYPRELKSLGNEKPPLVNFYPHGDLNYGILQKADEIAFILFAHLFNRFSNSWDNAAKEQVARLKNFGIFDKQIVHEYSFYRSFFSESEKTLNSGSFHKEKYRSIPREMRGAYSL